MNGFSTKYPCWLYQVENGFLLLVMVVLPFSVAVILSS